MSDSRFGGTPGVPGASGGGAGGDPYGFFTPPAGSSPTFGSSPGPSYGGPAATSFGAPAPGQVGTPYAAPASPGGSGRHGVRVAALVVVALVVLGGGWYGWRVWQHHQPVHVPSTLAGLPLATNPQITAAAAQIEKGMQQDNPGIQLEVRAYSDATGRVLFAGAARGRTDVDKDMSDIGAQVGPAHQVGSSTCATARGVGVTLCERSEGDLTVMAMSVRARGAAESEGIVAGLVNEVWSKV